jgi:hypothetical protein
VGGTCKGRKRGHSTFRDTTSGFASGHNTWFRKTVETLPDGNQNIVFTNFAGQLILHVFKETATGNQWRTFASTIRRAG